MPSYTATPISSQCQSSPSSVTRKTMAEVTNNVDDAATAPNEPSVDLYELATIVLASSIAASFPIRQLALHPHYTTTTTTTATTTIPSRIKQDGTIITDADGAAQSIIVSAIQRYCNSRCCSCCNAEGGGGGGGIKIVGEESKEEQNRNVHVTQQQECEEGNGGIVASIEEIANGGVLLPLTPPLSNLDHHEENDIDTVTGEKNAKMEEKLSFSSWDDIYKFASLEITKRRDKVSRRCGRQQQQQRQHQGQQSTVQVNGHVRNVGIHCNGENEGEGSGDDKEQQEEIEVNDYCNGIVQADRVSVFIDPLDGTKNYARGDFDSVTTLIAIILDNVPCFGVICKPFGDDYNNNNNVDCHVVVVKEDEEEKDDLLKISKVQPPPSPCFAVYGGLLLTGVFIAGGDEIIPQYPWRRRQLQQEQEQEQQCVREYKAVISSSRSKGIVQRIINILSSRNIISPTPELVSGAGEKALRLLIGKCGESLWSFPRPGTSLWDVAASDALLRAYGGKLTNAHGQELNYKAAACGKGDTNNNLGIIASNSVELHEECVKVISEIMATSGCGDNEEDFVVDDAVVCGGGSGGDGELLKREGGEEQGMKKAIM